MGDAVERDTSSNDVWIATHSFLPEFLGNQGYIRSLFFGGEKVAAPDWLNAEDIEIVGSDSAGGDLSAVTKTSQSKGKSIISREAIKNSLTIPTVEEAGGREWDFREIAV